MPALHHPRATTGEAKGPHGLPCSIVERGERKHEARNDDIFLPAVDRCLSGVEGDPEISIPQVLDMADAGSIGIGHRNRFGEQFRSNHGCFPRRACTVPSEACCTNRYAESYGVITLLFGNANSPIRREVPSVPSQNPAAPADGGGAIVLLPLLPCRPLFYSASRAFLPPCEPVRSARVEESAAPNSPRERKRAQPSKSRDLLPVNSSRREAAGLTGKYPLGISGPDTQRLHTENPAAIWSPWKTRGWHA